MSDVNPNSTRKATPISAVLNAPSAQHARMLWTAPATLTAAGELAAAVVTTNDFGDGQVLADLLGQVDDKLQQVTGDGGYDDRQCYEAIRERKGGLSSRRRRGRASGVMGTDEASVTRVMKTCATCARMGGRNGNVIMSTIGARWRR